MNGDSQNSQLPPELAGYRVLERIGQGGMGVVWKAEDRELERIVALKFLRPEVASDDGRRRRFLKEARLTASISDAGVVHVYGLNRSADRDVIIMEYVEGAPLRAQLVGRPLRPERVVEFGAPIARAMSHAHRNGVIHRDLKPENVIVSRDGAIKVVDFGVAVLVGPSRSASDSTVTMERPHLCGTVAYMSPEQARAEEVDERTDIFSLGVMLFEMATGRHPFRRPTLGETLEAVRAAKPVSPQTFVRDLPAELDRIVTKTLARRLDERYQTMGDLAIDLERVGKEIAAGTDGFSDEVHAPADPRSLVVLPTVVQGVRGAPDFVGAAFSDGVASSLATRVKANVLPTPDHATPASDSETDDGTLGRRLGAGRVVRIVLDREEERTRARVRVLDANANRILWAGSKEWPRADLDGLDEAIARDLASGLGLQLPHETYRMPIELVGEPAIAETPEGVRAIAALLQQSPEEKEAALALVERLPEEPCAHSLLVAALARAYFREPSAEAGFQLHAAASLLEVLDPKHPIVQLTRAYLFLVRGHRVDLAIRVFDRLLERDDLSTYFRAHSLRNRADAKLRVLDLDGALQDLGEALTLSPASAAVLGMLATALGQAGRHEEALHRARQALALYPAGVGNHLVVGACLRNEGRWREALPFYETVVDRVRTQMTLANCAVVLHRAGNADEARRVAAESAECTESTTGQYALACYHAIAGDPEDAIRLLKRSLDLGLSHGQMLDDPDLAKLRDQPGHAAIEAEVARRIGR